MNDAHTKKKQQLHVGRWNCTLLQEYGSSLTLKRKTTFTILMNGLLRLNVSLRISIDTLATCSQLFERFFPAGVLGADVSPIKTERSTHVENKHTYIDSFSRLSSTSFSWIYLLLKDTCGNSISFSSYSISHWLKQIENFSKTRCAEYATSKKLFNAVTTLSKNA